MTTDTERVLDPAYLGDLATKDTEELQAMRSDCNEIESKLSYLRRLVQGRLDIVSAELDRRAAGQAAGDLSALIELLPQILADRVHAPGPGRLPTNLVPPEDDDLTAELDAISGPGLASLVDTSEGELADTVDRLKALEQAVSTKRRSVFDVIDALEEEITRRYGDGNAAN